MNIFFCCNQFALRNLCIQFREGLLAQEIANKLVRCAPIFAHEGKRPSAWDKNVTGPLKNTRVITVSVLFAITLCDCRVKLRGVILVAFDIQNYQTVYAEGAFGHPLGPEVGFRLDLNIPKVW